MDVLSTHAGLATNDVYGKLARHVELALRMFLRHVAALHVSFEMFCVNATELSGYVGGRPFDCIEVSSTKLTRQIVR